MRLGRSATTVAGIQLAENVPAGTVSKAQGPVSKAKALFTGKALVPLPALFFGAFCTNNLIQDYFGTQDTEFFYASFITDKHADDIAEFYQAEDLLKIISFHPILFKLFMDRVVVGEEPESEEEAHLAVGESRMIVQNLGMEASFVITEEEEEIDGENVKVSFQRYERFLDYVPILHDDGDKRLLWDQTWTFGFRRLEDGRYEVYHQGHKFYGPWPVRLIILIHQRYVIWACEKYLSCEAFGSEADDAMDKREAELSPNAFWAGIKVGGFLSFALDQFMYQIRRLPVDGLWILSYCLPERSAAEQRLGQFLKYAEGPSEEEKKIIQAEEEELQDNGLSRTASFRTTVRVEPEMPHYGAWTRAPLASYARTPSLWRTQPAA
jgi:hypothetical protein